ncbi:hypothetical protein LSTR_LSTR002592 [Laodelphax striatellus]|uniref:Uncharacterized protein n=1 Tax=Laodelphax striatellus TaxID=195883 RepID=A0A482XMZ9_LAOST|nr:hypothetical protein LSTR_LSTR002592 [Laodelphax striatellus]
MDEFSPHNSHPRGGATPKHWRGIWRGVLPSHWPIIPLLLPPHTKNKMDATTPNGRKGAGPRPNTAVGRGILPSHWSTLPLPSTPTTLTKWTTTGRTGGKGGVATPRGRGYGGGACT